MNLSQLKAFILLAKGINETEAAKQLHCTQPSISMRIKKLEEELKTTLFERLNNRLYLTPQGRLYQQYASQIINMVDESSRHIRQFDDPGTGHIKFGASHFIGVYFMPLIISLFKKKYPRIKISMDISKSHQLIDKLNNQELDFLVMADNIYFNPKDYTLETFLFDPLVLICSPSHKLANQKKCNLSEVIDETFLFKSEHSSVRHFILNKIQCGSVQRNISDIMVIDSIEGIKQGVIHDLGVSVISNLSVKREVESGLLCSLLINDANLERGVRYVYNKNKNLTPATEYFLSLLTHEN